MFACLLAIGLLLPTLHVLLWSISNAGPVLFADILLPVLLCVLLAVAKTGHRPGE